MLHCKFGQKTKRIFSFLLMILIFSSLHAQNFYWENPVTITKTDSRFPSTLCLGQYSYVIWQEVDASSKQVYLTLRKYSGLTKFSENKRFAGPFTYSGEVPQLYSAAVSKSGTVAVAVLSTASEISVFTSDDGGLYFEENKITSSGVIVAPRIYATKNGFKIFASDTREDSFKIVSSDSDDGLTWSELNFFEPTSALHNPFNPVLISTPAGETVVFQMQMSSPATGLPSYQLYSTVRAAGSPTWSKPVLITDNNSISSRSLAEYYEYQNTRPYLLYSAGRTYVAWERTASVNAEIWVAELTDSGIVPDSAEAVATNGNSNHGILFEYKDDLYLVWYDTRRGNESVYMAKRNGYIWDEEALVENRNSNMFVSPFLINDGEGESSLTFVWQQGSGNSRNAIGWLAPDKTVGKPSLTPLNFKAGKRTARKNAEIQINFPSDSSNIAGYSYTWNHGESIKPEAFIQKYANDRKLSLRAAEDGDYYLSVRVQDYAGNWSESVELVYRYDITPPAAPDLTPLKKDTDRYGFLSSNSFRLEWQKSSESDVAGYSYRLDYLGNIAKNLAVSKNHPLKLSSAVVQAAVEEIEKKYEDQVVKSRKTGGKIQTSNTATQRYYNRANGVYLLSVSAIDEVGNVSPPSSRLVILNKFQPSTYISSVDYEKDEMGILSLAISGGGFTYDGTVSEIYIDADGAAPYDLVLKKDKGDFKVVSDKRIANINFVSELDEGKYKIGLLHTDRGLYMSGNILQISQNGTVKIESEYVRPSHLSSDFKIYKYVISVSIIVLAVLALAILVNIVIILLSIKNAVSQQMFVRRSAKSIVLGDFMAAKRKKTKEHLPSLKQKLVRFTYILIIIVVLMVMLMNAYRIIKIQETTLAQGLQNRAEVLLESVSTGVKGFLPTGQTAELTALPAQKDAMPEVKYITIIGQERDAQTAENLNFIWATNDADIAQKSNDYRFDNGESQLNDETILAISQRISETDKIIAQQVKEKSERIRELSQQQLALGSQDLESNAEEMAELSEQESDLRIALDAELREFGKLNSGSYPVFNPDDFNYQTTDYIFYRPVLYRPSSDKNSDNYIHGIVYLELSTQSLIENIKQEAFKIIFTGSIIAIAALIFGIIGSNVFASIIIKPIKALENHVLLIGRTKQKKDLKGKDVKIKTNDEIERLGNAINNMTRALIENEIEQSLLMDGSIVQNALLPLVPGTTYSDYSDDFIKCFGYYQAQTGVSGDFFDYKKLDETWYSFIKSDASGHGAPAALIATIVATIFRKYFETWNFKKNGTRINEVVEEINQFISELGLRGKFATLLVGLYNKKTGDVYLCNAGDNIVHIYDQQQHKVKTVTLANLPTAGVFDNDMIAMKGGFVVEKQHLSHGDVLFLYTDGIEESTRRMRFPDFSVQQTEKTVTQRNLITGKAEEVTKKEDLKEEFGPERVQQVIEAVFNREKYILTKEENPMKDEVLEFDFTNGQANLNEVIFALASLEKVFRLYKPEGLHRGEDFIRIDKNIDDFLSKYFNRYELYSKYKTESKDGPNYFDYEHMKEDEQSDDLTMLALQRI